MREQIVHFTPRHPQRDCELSAAAQITGDTLKERVMSAIRTVYDPELSVNLYDLGLIYDIKLEEDGAVSIVMTLTAPGCPVAGALPKRVEAAVLRLEEVNRVEVTLVWDPPWSRDMMTDEARLELGLV